MTEVHLVAPALWPPPLWLEKHRAQVPQLPFLQRCVARGRHTSLASARTYTHILFDLFGVGIPPDMNIPEAAATHWADFDSNHAGWWLRADPVHLRPDLGGLHLFDSSTFPLSLEEARALVDELNAHLAGLGLEISVGKAAKRWYMRLPAPSAIRMTPPQKVCGQHIDGFLPEGPDASRWHALGNELQMVLHQSLVNAARERRGEVPVNSVWFWGGGSVAAARELRFTSVVSDDAVAMGLARLHRCPLLVPQSCAAATLDVQRSQLLAFTSGVDAIGYDDFDGWCEALRRLDEEWVRRLWIGLQQGIVDQLALHLSSGACSVRREDCWKFWRRHSRLFRY